MSLDAGATDAPKLDDLLTLSPPPACSRPRLPVRRLLFLADGGRLHGRIVAAAERGIRVDFAIAPARTWSRSKRHQPPSASPLRPTPALTPSWPSRSIAATTSTTSPSSWAPVADGACPACSRRLSATGTRTSASASAPPRTDRPPLRRRAGRRRTPRPAPGAAVHLQRRRLRRRLLSADATAAVRSPPRSLPRSPRLVRGRASRIPQSAASSSSSASARARRIRSTFDLPWPAGADAGLFGGPAASASALFAKEPRHPRLFRLTYDLNEPFQRFDAVVGLDAADAPAGCAIFRVLVDDKPAFDSGPIRAADPPRDLSVPLAGARRLAIVLDFGPDLDLGDRGVWGQARLVR
ncbi:MAG: NPCBM/NEW2 domain-containing protein [Phycisphaerae bacterium]